MSMELSERSAFVGIHIKPHVKEALKDCCERAPATSMSQKVSDWIEEKLRDEGYDLRLWEAAKEKEPVLPFEESE